MRRRTPLRMVTSEASQQVVLKLKTTPRARRAFTSLAAAPAAVATASAERSPLASLFDRGLVASMQPLFPSRSVRRAAATERLILSVDEDPDRDLAGLNVMEFDTATDAADACGLLAGDPTVDYAHQPEERFPALPARRWKRRRRSAPRVDPLRNRQWGLGAIELPQAQAAPGFREAFDVTIAVIDSGVDAGHPDLQGIVADEQSFTSGPLEDTGGHGTHVCGIIAAATNNGLGVSGACQSRHLMSLKALGPFNAAGYYRAIRYATDNGAQVLNLSLGGGLDPTEELLLGRAISKGVVVVAAMGNESTSEESYPAAVADVISVGASTEVDGLAGFSNTGPHINLVAPGDNILSTVPTYPATLAEGTDYEAWPGTSMATPFVAATVALILAKRPGATLRQITEALEKGADKIGGETAFSERFGHGRLNVRRTLSRFRTRATRPRKKPRPGKRSA